MFLHGSRLSIFDPLFSIASHPQQGTNSQVLSATILLCVVRLLRERMRSVRPQPSLRFEFLPRTARSKDVRMAGVIYQRSVQGRAKHAARQRAYWARQRAKQLAAPSTPGVCFNARLRRHTLDSRIASPQASIPIAAHVSKREIRAQCSQDGPTTSLRTGASSALQQPDREPCCFVCARPSGFWLRVYPRYARPKAHRTRAP